MKDMWRQKEIAAMQLGTEPETIINDLKHLGDCGTCTNIIELIFKSGFMDIEELASFFGVSKPYFLTVILEGKVRRFQLGDTGEFLSKQVLLKLQKARATKLKARQIK